MCAYNRVNGAWSCENSEIQNGCCAGAGAFRGFVTSDWGAVHSPLAILRAWTWRCPAGRSSAGAGPISRTRLKVAVEKRRGSRCRPSIRPRDASSTRWTASACSGRNRLPGRASDRHRSGREDRPADRRAGRGAAHERRRHAARSRPRPVVARGDRRDRAARWRRASWANAPTASSARLHVSAGCATASWPHRPRSPTPSGHDLTGVPLPVVGSPGDPYEWATP